MPNKKYIIAARVALLKTSILALLLLSTACTVIPGSGMSVPLGQRISNFFEPKVKPVRTSIQYLPISAGLIEELRQRQASPFVPNHFRNAAGRYEYVVGAGDVLKINVWEQPGSFQSADGGLQQRGTEVHADGTIYYPYVGVMRAVGKTTYELRSEIVQKLNRVITDPRVDVQVLEYRSQNVMVSGEVLKPGQFPLDSQPMTVVRALQLAGGPGPEAWLGSVGLTRKGVTQQFDLQDMLNKGRWDWNIRLEDGDVLHIGSNSGRKVTVMGEVLRSRSIPVGRTPVTLAEALTEAGGINERNADARGIFVLRNVERRRLDGKTVYFSNVYQLNANRADAFLLAANFEMQPRDVVYVTAAPVARWNRLISALLPTLLATENVQDIERN